MPRPQLPRLPTERSFFVGAKKYNDALNTGQEISAEHDGIKNSTERLEFFLRASTDHIEASTHGFTSQSGEDVSFYTRGIRLEAHHRLQDDGATYSHDHWSLLDEHGDIIERGRCGDKSVLCNYNYFRCRFW